MSPGLKYTLIGLGGLIATGVLAVVIGVFWITRDLPSYDVLTKYEPPVTTRVWAGDGTLIGEYARERRLYVPIQTIPKTVRGAFLSAEDKNFYSHPGIDVFGIIRAAVNNVPNVLSGHEMHGGASTITQQVARTFNLIGKEVTITRKLREMVLAMRIDGAFSKDQILELYLNQIFLGQNSYGVAAAALNYFNKSLDELDPAEIAFLAALPKGPSNYDPIRHKDAAVARRNWVLDQMADNGYLTREEANAAKQEDLKTQQRAFGAVAPDVDYFVEEVRRTLYGKFGANALYDSGLQVHSTLQPHLQELAVRALRDGLIAYDRRHGWRGAVAKIDMAQTDWAAALSKVQNKSGVPSWQLAAVTGFDKNDALIVFADGATGRIPFDELKWARKSVKTWLGPEVRKPQDVVSPGNVVYVEALEKEPQKFALRQLPAINGAVVAIDPHTGHVLALSGGFSYASSEFNRATQAQRQVGSAFKPFVYATALDNGFTPITKVLDAPFVAPQGPGLPLWAPQNYEAGEYGGLMTLRRGIELSRNVMTARLAYNIGMEKIADTADRMGVYDKLPHMLSMSLGAGETTLLRLTTGYAEFVNGGRKLTPTMIDRIQDRHGKTIFRSDTRACSDCNAADWQNQEEPLLPDNRTQVVDSRTAFQIVSLLEGVVQRGTGSEIGKLGKPLAGKTGTSSDYHDAWFVGFSPDLAFGVFVGFDDPRSLGKGETGAQAAAPIFKEFMGNELAGQPATPFRIPSGVVLVPVDANTGTPEAEGTPGTILEAFKPGTEPGAGNIDFLFQDVLGDQTVTDTTETDVSSATNVSSGTASAGRDTGGLY
jgi:penicillin-binding protein 1A